MLHKRIQFLGLPLDTGIGCEDVCRMLSDQKAVLVTFINPSAWPIARRDANYLETLNQMSLVLPDGQGVAWGARFLTHEDARRISFDMTSLADPFFHEAVKINASIALIGGKPGVTEDVRDKLIRHYAGLNVVEATHGYGELELKIAEAMKSGAKIIVAGMGAPRQEVFLLALKKAGFTGMAITCGGFFDQYLKAEDKQYYPAWIDRWNLRFLYRLFKEPKRLWRRYLIEYSLFVGLFTQSCWKLVKEKVQMSPCSRFFERSLQLIKSCRTRQVQNDKIEASAEKKS